MNTPIRISLFINVAVLVPVCASLLLNLDWTHAAFGPPTAARGILTSVYLAILILSLGLFVKPKPDMVAALLAVQIIYKVTTPLTVGTLLNPVVISNLAIATVHTWTIWRITRRAEP